MATKEWELHYAFLNAAQLKDPVWVIFACAMGDTIFKDRNMLFDIFYAAVGSRTFQDHEAKRIRDYIYCWERMITMIESCHRLGELKLKGQFHYSYSGDIVPR